MEEYRIPKEVQEKIQAVQIPEAKAIVSREEAESATETLKMLKDTKKEITAQKKNLLEPIAEAEKRIRDFFRKPEAIIDRAISEWADSMGTFKLAEERRIAVETAKKLEAAKKIEEAERAKLEKSAAKAEAKGNMESAEIYRSMSEEISVPVDTVEDNSKIAGLSFRTDWEVSISDPDLVPREYCTPFLPLIKADIKKCNGKIAIPGVKFLMKKTPVNR